ncbi:nucleic acid binding domain-containing protein [Desulfonema limicola]|uniref:Nucleic acid binding domain-containing protein n=1 Tax=Desulfonema limicola TaxID=45656 RepID=A0A975B498_9BACT|nr:hypothetical protein [Desulfonema limicola]QTA78515.1 nucleic acid binding domain-containing protein [Desulfonema limicola]
MANTSSETADKALCMSIETAVRQYYKVSDCQADLEDRTVNIVFQIPEHKHIVDSICPDIVYAEKDIAPVTLNMASLPRKIVRISRVLLDQFLAEIRLADDFARWKRRRNHIMEGIIKKRFRDYIEVDLNGKTALLTKRNWVQKEMFLYEPGRVLFFHIYSVTLNNDNLSMVLSRRSKLLPQLLLKSHLPMYRFYCRRRFPGEKSRILTDAPIRDSKIIEVRDRVSRELSGEILEMRNSDGFNK